MKLNFLLSVLILFTNPLVFSFESYEKLMEEARLSWLDGRPQDAIENYKYIIYISTEDEKIINATRELAVLLNEAGENSIAKIYIEKAQAIKNDDPYLEYEKGWALLSMKKYPEAKASFENVLTMTTNNDLIYNSRFMQAMCEINLGGPIKAIEDFQTVYNKYPYLLSLSSYMIAKCYQELKKRSHSITFLKETLQYDERNIQALITLAENYEDVNYYLPAWQSYYTLSEIDIFNEKFSEKVKKLSKNIKGKPDHLLFWQRLGWPIHSEPLKIKPNKKIKIGIYTDASGKQAFIKKFYFIANTDFEIIDSKLGKTYTGKKNMQYEVSYQEKSRIFEVKDNTMSKIYTTRQNFSIKTLNENGVILIKNPEIDYSIKGINRSDRELSNEIIVKISTEGMKITNNTYLEHILPAIISGLNIPKNNTEFLKAVSVVIRTILYDSLSNPFSQDYNIFDNLKDMEFKGLQYENPEVVKATEETKDEILYSNDSLPKVSFNYSCGGETDQANDNSNKPEKLTPYSLNNWFLSAPNENLYCLPEDATRFSSVIWNVLLEPYWIEERANKRYKIGKIKNIQVLKRNSRGEVLSIIIKGSANDLILQDQDEINEILAANTLRSMLFNIRPLMSGSFPQYFMIRGIGTGKLKGLCLMGSYGMAKNLGYKYEKILKHYFPKLTIKKNINLEFKKSK